MEKNKFNFYGITNDFQKDFLFSCEKEERDGAKQIMPPINKEYLCIISEYEYVVYPYDDTSFNGRIYYHFELLDLILNKKYLILRNYRISPKIVHNWRMRMDNKFIQFTLEDTNTGEEIVLKADDNRHPTIDLIIENLRLINTYGLTEQVLARINNFQI